MLAWYKILYYLCNRERERQTLHDSKFNHKTNEMFGGSASPARLVSGAIPADTAMVSVYDSELLGCLNEAGAKADAVVRIEGETPYFVFIYSLE